MEPRHALLDDFAIGGVEPGVLFGNGEVSRDLEDEVEPETHEAPVGLTSDEPSVEGPSFGSEIVVGSAVLSSPNSDQVEDEHEKPPTVTASADPFGLEDGFLRADCGRRTE